MASMLIASRSTPAASWIAEEIWSAWWLFNGSVWTRMLFFPEEFTTGAPAAGMLASAAFCATAFWIFSTLASVAWPGATATWYSTPPWNSMPRLKPRNASPLTAASTIRPEMEYHSHFRPTKSIETWPS